MSPANLPLLRCNNCRETKLWNGTTEKDAVIKMPLGNGRYTVTCYLCKEPLKILEKAEADLFINVYGALPVEQPIQARPASAPVGVGVMAPATDAKPTHIPVQPQVPKPSVDIEALKSKLEDQMTYIVEQLEKLKSMEKK